MVIGKSVVSASGFAAIRFVLVNPTHPGNIGAAARAIKNMGFTRLYLVTPEKFPHPEATARASGADDVLATAVVTNTLQQALMNCSLIIGTSARLRSLPWPILTLPQAALRITEELVAKPIEIAVVFGQERIGLSNQEMEQCHYLLNIPCNPEFSSLNLAAAVQLVAYQIRLALMDSTNKIQVAQHDEYATADEMALFFEHLRATLIDIEFLDPNSPKRLMSRLRRLFNRARPKKPN